MQATGSTSWRRGDVKYKKNEAFVDVVETVNLSMSAKGELIFGVLYPERRPVDPFAIRDYLARGRRWAHYDASVLVRYTGMQVRIER